MKERPKKKIGQRRRRKTRGCPRSIKYTFGPMIPYPLRIEARIDAMTSAGTKKAITIKGTVSSGL
jgi:hypothetical protein